MSGALPTVPGLAEARRLAEQRGARLHLVDGAALATKAAAVDAIAAALSFPEHFGRNLDALFDSLRDLSWLPGEHLLALTEPRALEAKAWRGIEKAVADAVAQNLRLHAVLVRS